MTNRISASLSEHHIPDEVDYVVLGSGAGGAIMSYRDWLVKLMIRRKYLSKEETVIHHYVISMIMKWK
ncbi:MAG: hypothetical protein R3A12_19600 [Ignavibacteria bacterium]